MPDEKFTILSTRPVDQFLIDQAFTHNIRIDTISFIRTEAVKDPVLEERINFVASQPATVIFTSMNAADAVADCIPEISPQWQVYCLGTATKNIIQHRFPKSDIIGEADNASLLAEEIISRGERKATFFCGNQRRDELPGRLASANINIDELVVYNTFAVDEKIKEDYDGILFFSPSAVKSFFSQNTVAKGTILFAIGTTTAASIKDFSDNKIVEANNPGKEHLVEKAIEYFGTLNYTNDHVKK